MPKRVEAKRLLARPGSGFLRACAVADPGQWATRHRASCGADIAAGNALVIGRASRPFGRPLDIVLREGEITAVQGASGVGKTTLGDTMLGLAAPVAGQVSWFGRALDRSRRRALRPRFQKLHQDPTAVFPAGRTFSDSMADLRRLPGGTDATSRVAGLMERLSVPDRLLAQRPGEVSGGEAQRLALVRLLALRPALLVADEPCSRLDPPVQAEAMALLRSLADQDGVSVLLITHDPQIPRTVADATITLNA